MYAFLEQVYVIFFFSSVEDAVSPEATESHGDNPTQSKG